MARRPCPPPGALALLLAAAVALSAAPTALAAPPRGVAEAEPHGSEGACDAADGLHEIDDDVEGLSLLQATAQATRGRAAAAASAAATAATGGAGAGSKAGGALAAKGLGPPTPPAPPEVVPAPFNAPAPPAASLIPWTQDATGQAYDRQGKWIWQMVNYQRNSGGVGNPLSLSDTLPSPAPPPYSSRLANPTKSPVLVPLNGNTELSNPAVREEREHAWRDCTVADWTEWSCCGCETPPGYEYPGTYQVRYRPVTTPHSKWGTPCAPMTEVIDCVPAKPAFQFSLGALDLSLH